MSFLSVETGAVYIRISQGEVFSQENTSLRFLPFGVKYLPHGLPFLDGGGGGVAALELAYVGFPFSLAGKGGQAGHTWECTSMYFSTSCGSFFNVRVWQ